MPAVHVMVQQGAAVQFAPYLTPEVVPRAPSFVRRQESQPTPQPIPQSTTATNATNAIDTPPGVNSDVETLTDIFNSTSSVMTRTAIPTSTTPTQGQPRSTFSMTVTTGKPSPSSSSSTESDPGPTNVPVDGDHPDSKLIPILVGTLVGAFVVIAIIATFFILRRRRWRRQLQPIIDPFDANQSPPMEEIPGQPLDLAGSRRGSIITVQERLPRKISPFSVFAQPSTSTSRKSSLPQSRTSLLDREEAGRSSSDEMRTRDDLAASRVIDRLRAGGSTLPRSNEEGTNNLSEADVARIALRVAALIGRDDAGSHRASEPPPEYCTPNGQSFDPLAPPRTRPRRAKPSAAPP